MSTPTVQHSWNVSNCSQCKNRKRKKNFTGPQKTDSFVLSSVEEDGPLRDGNQKAIEQKKAQLQNRVRQGKKVYLCNSEGEPTFGLPTSACYMVGMHVLTLLPSSSFFLHEFCPFAQSCFSLALSIPELHIFYPSHLACWRWFLLLGTFRVIFH